MAVGALRGIYPLEQTLRDAVVAHGVGLHSGRDVQMLLRPAPVGAGIVFQRVDIAGTTPVAAHTSNISNTLLATSLGTGDHAIQTVEHVLSAIIAMGLDNVRVEVDAPEIPVFDGSSAPIVRAIRSAGLEFQPKKKRVLVVTEDVRVETDKGWIAVRPSLSLRIDLTIDFAHPVVGRQRFVYDHSPEAYESEIAQARTFGFVRDLDYLRQAGLGKGGSLDNAVVIAEDGVANPGGLRYPDEFVRHKILDIIGDFALAGGWVVADIEAYKSGHELNRQCVNELLRRGALKSVEVDQLDFSAHSSTPVAVAS